MTAGIFGRQAGLQAKLRVGAVNDPLEREADRAAERVVSGSAPFSVSGDSPDTLRRECAHCEEDETQTIRRQASTTRTSRSDTPLPPAVEHSLKPGKTGGHSLQPALRQTLESRFGADFTKVRIHHGREASALAGRLGARAFTLGDDIYFDRGEYHPHDRPGLKLLAHELTHVIQQRGATPSWVQRSPPPAQTVTIDEQADLLLGRDYSGDVAPLFDPLAIASAIQDVLRTGGDPTRLFDAIAERLLSSLELFEIARALVETMSEADVKTLLGSSTGHAFALRLLGIVKMQPGYKLAGPIKRAQIAPLSATALASIRTSNFPNDDVSCMDRVNTNIKFSSGSQADRVLIDMEAEAELIAPDQPRKNSHNAFALENMNRAEYLGESGSSRNLCIDAIEYNLADSKFGSEDPFVFRKPTEIFQPDPEQAMLDAVADHVKGTYMFLASVAAHHSVTFFLEKKKDGRLTKGSNDYVLYWNDQYNDGGGNLGLPIQGHELTKKIFYMSFESNSNPALWKERTDKKGNVIEPFPRGFPKNLDDAKDSPERRNSRDFARKKRCATLKGIQLWLVYPGD
jgi:hypothetical protein